MRRLYSRIYLHFLGVLFVVALATGGVFAVGTRGAFLRELTERIARHVAGEVGERFADRRALDRVVERLHEELEIDVTVRDLDGNVRSVAGPELPRIEGPDASRLERGEVVVRQRPRWSAAAPIRDPASGALVGTIAVSAQRRFHPPSLLRPAFTVALVLLIVAVAVGPLARRISRPVERLTEATRRLGSGDLSYRVNDCEPHNPFHRHVHHVHRSDELFELTRAFNEMADRIERLVGGQRELLANVSHELRSPLARIRVALELLPRDGESEARFRDLEADLGELDRLIEDVLTASRLDATGLPTHLEQVELRALLDGLVERARHDPATAGKTVRAVDGPLPAVTADGALLRRALWNLVENAGKYGAPPITLAAELRGDRIALSVSDEGEGIPAADRERVLIPFFRMDKARTPGRSVEGPRGFGLGLTLARRIAEVHGGAITIAPAATVGGVERGCRVTIELPARR